MHSEDFTSIAAPQKSIGAVNGASQAAASFVRSDVHSKFLVAILVIQSVWHLPFQRTQLTSYIANL